MLTRHDILALSLWPRVRSRRLAEFLGLPGRPDGPPAAPSPTEPGPVDALLVAALEAAGADPPADGLAAALRAQVPAVLARSARAGLELLVLGDALYPPLLAQIPDPPLALWLRGRADVLGRPSIAIVGSRTASHYGLSVAGELAADLARAGLSVVSGMARGVDSAAHRGALRQEGTTVAVLGSGADVIYPPEHSGLAASIAETGAVVSEFPPGEPPRPLNFPLRNRIISGLSMAVVVVEAADRSGSLITARAALEQGREVLAVPGSVLSGRNAGCHALLRDGAALVESADDVLMEIRTIGICSLLPGVAPPCLPAAPSWLAGMTAGESHDLDELVALSGLGPARLLSVLLDLELRGAVVRVAGGRFVRVTRTC